MPEPLINLAALEPLFAPHEEPNRHRARGTGDGPAEIRNGRRPSPSGIAQNLRRFVTSASQVRIGTAALSFELPPGCDGERRHQQFGYRNREIKLGNCPAVNNSGPVRRMHVYEVRPRKDRRGFDLISEALPFGRLWYQNADVALGYAKSYSPSQSAELRVFDAAGALIAVDSWTGNFKEA